MPRRNDVANIRLTDAFELEGRELEPDPRSMPGRRPDGRRDRRTGVGLLILALAAFVPMLASRPGRLILDTHDGLHLDPAGTLATAASRWDPIGALGMFADKTYDYTFPMSQWFWFGDRIGLPMWVTHRLWVGLLLFAAGTGVVFLLRTMNWTEQSWLVAALAYQCSPYVLLYAGSRSTVLLAWAALPWLIAFTMRSLVDPGWRSPAWCAVIVALVGPGNVPATIYVALACLVWFLYATVATKDVGWRDAMMPFGRIASLCTIVSVWWITSLLVHPSAAFANLRTSARLDSVQEATPVSEVVRGLGSWRLYTLDESNAIAAGIDLQRSPWLIAAGFALPAIAIATMVRIRFPYRLYFVTLFTLGAVLSTGTYARGGEGEPFSRGMRSLVDHGAGALLSPSNRAMPLFWLAVSIGVGVGVHRFAQLAPRMADIARVGVVALIVVGALPIFRGAALDGARAIPDGIPEYWHEAADYVNSIESSNNILELPALMRATYTWGSPNQPISYTLFDRPVGLVDPGSPPATATATLLRELDQRIQRGELSPRQLVTVARMLAVDTIVVRADGRGDTGRAASVRSLVEDASSEPPRDFGTMPDGTPAVAVYRVDGGPDRHSTTAADRLTVMSGSAAGVLDLIRGGVVDQDLPLVVDEADLQQLDLVGSVPNASPVALTDSARPLVTDRYFATGEVAAGEHGRTTIEWAGVAGISARTAGDDEPIDPSQRLMLAFDDDPATSWLTGGGSAQVDATIDIRFLTPVTTDSITIAQPTVEAPTRQITSVKLVFNGRKAVSVPLDATSATAAGQVVSFDRRAFTWLKIVVTGVGPGDTALPVGFSALEIPDVQPTEVLRLPTSELVDDQTGDHSLVVSTTRWRGESLGAPPLETRFHRRFVVQGERDGLVARADVRGDPGPACRNDLVTIDGKPIDLQVEPGQGSQPSDAVFSMQSCDGTFVDLEVADIDSSDIDEPSIHEVSTVDPTDNPRRVVVERVVLHEAEAAPSEFAILASPIVSLFGQTSAAVVIPDASTPLWLVQAASADSGWAATEDDGSLAAPRLVNGFASGWPITTADGEPHKVEIRYAPQRAIDIAIIVSAVGFALVLALALRPRRSSGGPPPAPPSDPRRYVHPLVVVIVSLGVFGLTAGPLPGIIAGLTALLLEQRPHLFNRVAWLPTLLLLGAGLGRAVWQVVEAPAIGPTWPGQAPLVDSIVWVAISMAVAMALGNTDYRPIARPPIRSRR